MNMSTTEGVGSGLEIVTSVVIASFLGLIIAGWRPGNPVEDIQIIGLFIGAMIGLFLPIYSAIKKYQPK